MKELKLKLTEPKEKGAIKGWIKVPLEELAEGLHPLLTGSLQSSEADAQKLADLEQDNAALKQKAEKFDKFEELIKTPEGFVEIARDFGYDVMLPSEMADLKEADIIHDPETPPDPENWRHLKWLGAWIRKKN